LGKKKNFEEESIRKRGKIKGVRVEGKVKGEGVKEKFWEKEI
jgi:hypothetical protein